MLDRGTDMCDRTKREIGGWAEKGKRKRLKIDWRNQKLGATE